MMIAQLMPEQSSPFKRLTEIAGEGDLMAHLSSQSAGSMVQHIVGRLRRLGDVPLSVLLT